MIIDNDIVVLECLNASFKQENGCSIAGTDWLVLLHQNETEYKILIRSYEKDLLDKNQDQKVECIIDYVSRLLQSGWTPDKYKGNPGELTYCSESNLIS